MERLKKIQKLLVKHKYNIYTFLGMLAFSIIICINFIRPHLALDTYCVYSYSSQELISHFLVSNRIFSALARWIFDILGINFIINTELLVLAGILFLTIAWFILFKFISKLKKHEMNIFSNILFAGISFIIVFNFCTIESLVFWESGIMCLGILCTVIAACLFNSNMKFKRIKAFISLLLGSLCYQGAITIFIPLALVLLAYKYKENFKKIFIETLKIGLIYIIVMVINLIATKIFSNIFSNEFRKMAVLSITDLCNTAIRLGSDMILKTFGIGTKYWYVLLIVAISILFLICCIKNKKFKLYVFEYFVLLGTCILIPILPMLVTPVESQYLETRMAMSFGSSIGILILFLSLVIEAKNYKLFNKLLAVIVFIMVMLNALYYILASSEMITTNYLDRNIAETITKEIENYQTETGVTIENIGICFDKNPTTNYEGQRWLGVITTRSMGTDWTAKETIELYSGKRFNKIEVPNENREEFLQKDWSFFDKEQLIFDNNNLYICLY
jgi:membrane protein